MTSLSVVANTPDVKSRKVAGLPFDLEIIPNVLTNTLVDNYDGDPEDTTCLYLVSFTFENEQYGATLAVPEVDLQVSNTKQNTVAEQIAVMYNAHRKHKQGVTDAYIQGEAC